MPTVVLAAPLARYLTPSTQRERSFQVAGATVREAIEQVLAEAPILRSYLLDDQGGLRHHIAAFIDGVVVRDKPGLTEAVAPTSEIYLVQALSGG